MDRMKRGKGEGEIGLGEERLDNVSINFEIRQVDFGNA